MLQVEVNKDTGELTIYHKFKIGDKIFVRSSPKKIQKPQVIDKIIVFVRDIPIVCYTVGHNTYCTEQGVNFFNDKEDTGYFNVTKFNDYVMKIGDKVTIKYDCHKTPRVITDMELYIRKDSIWVFYYLDGNEDDRHGGRYFEQNDLKLIA